jgi:hypothetical protein
MIASQIREGASGTNERRGAGGETDRRESDASESVDRIASSGVAGRESEKGDEEEDALKRCGKAMFDFQCVEVVEREPMRALLPS